MTTPSSLSFQVFGFPAPQGSKNAYQRGGQIVLVESSRTLPAWREAIITAAREANTTGTPFITPVSLDVVFRLPKPQRPKFPEPGVSPDLDKLLRGIGDALQIAHIIKNDALIVAITAVKEYTEEAPGAFITITTRPRNGA